MNANQPYNLCGFNNGREHKHYGYCSNAHLHRSYKICWQNESIRKYLYYCLSMDWTMYEKFQDAKIQNATKQYVSLNTARTLQFCNSLSTITMQKDRIWDAIKITGLFVLMIDVDFITKANIRVWKISSMCVVSQNVRIKNAFCCHIIHFTNKKLKL